MDDLQAQLDQMRQALDVASPNDRPGLQSIICQLEELISLSGTNIPHSAESIPESTSAEQSSTSFADDEFKRFQDEIAELDAADNNSGESNDNGNADDNRPETDPSDYEDCRSSIMNEMSALEGTKCSAPHQPSWGQLGYYNAIIISVEPPESTESEGQNGSNMSMDLIMVRVVFTQPIVESMLPCPFYQENRCRFADNECKFSHGEIVSLSTLRDYKEPNFSQVVPGCRVLAKYKNGLWYRATVLRSAIDEDSQIYQIEYDDGKEILEIPLHDTTPLDSNDEDSDSSSDSEVDLMNGKETDETAAAFNFKVFEKEAFGDWEKYTLGMGSKLMAKMGYIQGGGLGKNGEGRLEPVEVKVYPQGVSLDTCIEMRERTGRKAMTVEEKLKRQSKKALHSYKQRKNSAAKGNVFDFLNSNLKTKGSESSSSIFNISKGSKNLVQINKASSSTLNKSLLNVGENINQVKKRISKLKEGLQRQSSMESAVANSIKEKIKDAEKELSEMEKREGSLLNERKNRHEKKKLAVF